MAKFGKKVNKPKKAKRENRDVVRTGNTNLTTNIYQAKIVKAYIYETPAGANMIKAEFKFDNGKILRISECFQSGDKKNNQIFYEDKDGNEHYLPGWDIMNELLSAAMGEDLLDDSDEPMDIFDLFEAGDVENKKIPLYDFDKKKDVPTKVPVILPLIGKSVRLGVQDVFVDIGKKVNGKFVYEKGKSVPSGKYKRTNQIDKFFNVDSGQTFVEMVEDKDAEFYKDWLTMKDHVYDYTANKIAPVQDGKVVAVDDSSDDDGSSKRSTNSLFKKK